MRTLRGLQRPLQLAKAERAAQEMPLTNLGELQPAALEFGNVPGEDDIRAVACESLVRAGFQCWNR
jgi:hypothetical protein